MAATRAGGGSNDVKIGFADPGTGFSNLDEFPRRLLLDFHSQLLKRVTVVLLLGDSKKNILFHSSYRCTLSRHPRIKIICVAGEGAYPLCQSRMNPLQDSSELQEQACPLNQSHQNLSQD